ncbi:MAG: helix-turn-helix transcriptional regulator [Pseudomonadota bacterium]
MTETATQHLVDAEPSAYLVLIGERVRQYRGLRGMSRRVLSEASGVSVRYLAELEAGRGNASITVLKQIADAFDMPIDDMLDTRTTQSGDYLLLRRRVREADDAAIERWLDATRERPSMDEPKRFVALVGLRGAGKSTLGRALSNALRLPLIELVREVETMAGMPVGEVFSLGGQVTYRRLEKAAMEQIFASHRAGIVAVGGSLVSEPESFEQLRAHCHTVWVQAEPHQHMQRVIAQGDQRPMANSQDAMQDLRRILAERGALYARADETIDTSDVAPEQSLSDLLALPTVAEFATRT